MQAKCKGKTIEVQPVAGIDVDRLTDITRAVLLLQRPIAPTVGDSGDTDNATAPSMDEHTKVLMPRLLLSACVLHTQYLSLKYVLHQLRSS